MSLYSQTRTCSEANASHFTPVDLERRIRFFAKAQNDVAKAQNDVAKAQNDLAKAQNDVAKAQMMRSECPGLKPQCRSHGLFPDFAQWSAAVKAHFAGSEPV